MSPRSPGIALMSMAPSRTTQGGDVTAVDQVPDTTGTQSAFADELRLRVEEATASLEAAEAMGDPLLAQIAAGDLADLHALAVRNDVDLP
ncbi:MAG: hypothetical protein JWM62_2718 [Frankiales bacterium]|jgi:hypothetical protein|nr:hypothetical protein [Frankiales bacterium]